VPKLKLFLLVQSEAAVFFQKPSPVCAGTLCWLCVRCTKCSVCVTGLADELEI
jgi:hypothetical protein